MTPIVRAFVAVIALLCASVSHADGTVEERQEAVKLYRGTSVIAASDPKSSVYVPNFTPVACEQLREARWQAEALTREDGKATYKCQVETRAVVAFHPNPTCPPLPPPEGRVVDCPAGFTGAYTQTLSYSAAPYPTCSLPGAWVPAEPPAGICAPIDSDNDGVPDSEDECPTVYAAGGPNGCPATPPSEWTFCANEWQLCPFTGTRRVRYGAGSAWVERDVTAVDGGVQCRNSVFGDPIPGTVKRCELRNGSSESQPEPSACVGRVCRLIWTHEGTPAEGFRIVYGQRADQLPGSIQVTPGTVRTADVTVTAAGTWYFAIIAFGGGTDSSLSNVESWTVQ